MEYPNWRSSRVREISPRTKIPPWSMYSRIAPWVARVFLKNLTMSATRSVRTACQSSVGTWSGHGDAPSEFEQEFSVTLRPVSAFINMRRAQLNARSSRPSGRVANQPATGDRFHPVAKLSVAPIAIDMLNMPAQIQRIPENSNIPIAAVLSLRREIANRANAPHDAIALASHSSVA
jgi:hypothetical protein